MPDFECGKCLLSGTCCRGIQHGHHVEAPTNVAQKLWMGSAGPAGCKAQLEDSGKVDLVQNASHVEAHLQS